MESSRLGRGVAALTSRSGASAGPVRFRVFATGSTFVQLDWRHLPPGPHRVAIGQDWVHVEGGDPGAVSFGDLQPSTDYTVELDGEAVTTATTLTPPPGPVLSRIATLSDLHVGETWFGKWPRVWSHTDPAQAHPILCVRAAIAEIVAWGPDLLVIKGDLVDHHRPAEYELLAGLLEGVPFPIVLMPGNHDGGNYLDETAPATLSTLGLDWVDHVDHVDLPGVRLVAANSVWPGKNRGRLGPRLADLTEQLATAPGPVLLAVHHQPMPWPVPHYPPTGMLWPDSTRALDAIAATNPATLMTCGHSHRHRRREHGPIVITEVGSPKDHPGTWAAYEAYSTGIVQTVRRVADPASLRWTEKTWDTLLTLWSRWAVGRLGDRCFSHQWPYRAGSNDGRAAR